jgi:hypothetical protein
LAKVKNFRKFLDLLLQKPKDRSRHFTWGANDVEHHGKTKDRSGHFLWRKGDVEHHKKTNEGLLEYTHDKPLDKRFNHPANKEAQTLHNDLYNSFSKHHDKMHEAGHFGAIQRYKQDSSEHYNDELRKSKGLQSNHSAGFKERVASLDKVTSHRIPMPMTTYRGGIPGDADKFPVGHEFTDHGYSGTSLNASTSGSFSKAKNDIRIIHVISMPKGTKAHYLDVNRDTDHAHENEVLLHRGTKFKVTHHSVGKNHYSTEKIHYIHSKVISQRGSPDEAKPKIKVNNMPSDEHLGRLKLKDRLEKYKFLKKHQPMGYEKFYKTKDQS